MKPFEEIENDEDLLQELKSLIDGQTGAYRDAVLLNSSAALLIAGRVKTLKQGVNIAAKAIDSGATKKTLSLLAKLTSEKI